MYYYIGPLYGAMKLSRMTLGNLKSLIMPFIRMPLINMTFSMDKLQLTGQNLGLVFNIRCKC